MKHIGAILLLVALVASLLAAVGLSWSWMGWVLALLGALYGVLALDGDSTQPFIIVALGLGMASASLNSVPAVGPYITTFATSLAAFTAAAALIAALRWLWDHGGLLGMAGRK